jgi:16S rRNA processing protein RimM
VRGEIRLAPDEPSLAFPDIEEVRLIRKGRASTLRLESLREVDGAYLVAFEGFVDRDQVRDQLAGGIVWVPRSTLEDAGAGEAYVYELVGARVVDASGTELGTVGAILAGAGQDLLRIDPGERLLPMVPDTMRGFDRVSRVLTVAPIPGLWDE